MATKKKLLQAAAGTAAAGGAGGLDITDVFSTYLYEGNNSTQTITNGIDLSGEGGLVWIKLRSTSAYHALIDTERGAYNYLSSNTTGQQSSDNTVTQFNSDGFNVGNSSYVNYSPSDIVSWTFRKAPKFFDVVTYTGDGSSSRDISHNLGSTPGFIVYKKTNTTSEWIAWHNSLPNNYSGNEYIRLNSNSSTGNYTANLTPSSTTFKALNPAISSAYSTNTSGDSYVAYLFAHNDGDGEFGPDADADIIKCGSYTGNGSTTGPEIDLGFEPQWVMIKRTSGNGDFAIFDNMRGITSGGVDGYLIANGSQQEYQIEFLQLLSNGFQPTVTNTNVNASGSTYIYIAIRRGPMAVPEDATDVFAMDDRSGGPPNAVSGFPVDMAVFTNKTASDNKYTGARLIQGKRLYTNLTSAEGSSSELAFDYSTGFIDRSDTSTDNIHWMWRRAPSFCDVVAYTGNGTSGRTISHNLGVAPEMMWVKRRDASQDWKVYHTGLTSAAYYLDLNGNSAESLSSVWASTDPTDAVFSVGSNNSVNASGGDYIAYLFASLDNISKCGSYTGNGTGQNIDCGFSSGARFVLIKKFTDTGHWQIYDTTRGIVAGDDPRLALNLTSAELTGYDMVDPYSGGFAVTSRNDTNENGYQYLFYAIA